LYCQFLSLKRSFMKYKLIFLTAGLSLLLAVATLAQAQQGATPPAGGRPGQGSGQGGQFGGQGGRFGQNPQMQAAMKKYQSWFDLMSTIRLMSEVDKQPKLTFTKAQTQKMLPTLKSLQTKVALTPQEATTIITLLEDKVISVAQLKWMDATVLKQAEDRRKRQEAQRLAQQNTTNPAQALGALGQGAANPQAGAAGQGGNRGQGGLAGAAGRPAGAAAGAAGQNGQARGPGGGGQTMFTAMLANKPFNPFKDGTGKQSLDDLVKVLAKR
jgi:hypothetical protein